MWAVDENIVPVPLGFGSSGNKQSLPIGIVLYVRVRVYTYVYITYTQIEMTKRKIANILILYNDDDTLIHAAADNAAAPRLQYYSREGIRLEKKKTIYYNNHLYMCTITLSRCCLLKSLRVCCVLSLLYIQTASCIS